jgi:hypothetical protein
MSRRGRLRGALAGVKKAVPAKLPRDVRFTTILLDEPPLEVYLTQLGLGLRVLAPHDFLAFGPRLYKKQQWIKKGCNEGRENRILLDQFAHTMS